MRTRGATAACRTPSTLAMDRDNIIDFAYLGKGKPSTIQHLNWYHGWAIPDDEMRQLPGYKPVKD